MENPYKSKHYREQFDRFVENADKYDAMADMIDEIVEAVNGTYSANNTRPGPPYIAIQDSLRSRRRLEKVVGMLQKHGYKFVVRKDPDENNNNIRYYYANEDDVTVEVLLWLPMDTPEAREAGVCRMVQTGTKEVPVYEMKCGK